MTHPLRVGLIGYGYWGPNVARNLAASPATQLITIAESNPARREAAVQLFPKVGVVADSQDVLDRADLQAVVIATPLQTHFGLAKAALLAGKHVLVEKPLATSTAECDELISLANARELTLMVDHTFVFTGLFKK